MRVLTDCLCFCMPFRVFVCFGHSWAVLGRSRALLGCSWASPGQVLDAHGALLGHLDALGALLGHSWALLGAFWRRLAKKGRCDPLFEAQLGAQMDLSWSQNPIKIGFKK